MKHNKIFFGWWIVLASFLTSAYTAGMVSFAFTAIIEPIAAEFGWSYTQISLAVSLRGMEAGLLAPFVGLIVDRFGPRKIMIGGAAVYGLGLVLLGGVNSLALFYVVFILISLGPSTCAGVVPMATIGNWFRKKVAFGIGIAACGTGAGGALVPLVTYLVDTHGWRTAMAVLGLGAWLLLIPLALLFRHKPEKYGYLPDGATEVATTASQAGTPKPEAGANLTVKQILKNRIFWQIALGISSMVLIVMAVTTQAMPYMATVNVPRSTASFLAGAMSVISIPGRLACGWLGDRYEKRWVTAISLMMISLGLVLIAIANGSMHLMLPAIVIFGLGFGGPPVMLAALLQEYFGRPKLGTLLGLAYGVMMAANMVGPVAAAAFYEATGSYQGIWFILAGVLIAGALGVLAIRRDRRVA